MALTPEIVTRLTAHMKPQSADGGTVILAFIQQQDGTWLMAAPIPLTWPEIIAAVAHQREILVPT